MASDKKAPATFYTVQGANDIYWRVQGPAKAIGAKTCIIPESKAQEELNGTENEYFKWRISEDEGEDAAPAVYPEHEGTAIWTRPDALRAAHIDAMQLAGIPVIAECDDNYIADPNKNIFTRINQFDRNVHLQHMGAMASGDKIVWSTEWLRDYYWKALKKIWRKQELPEMLVCRNCIAEEDWPEVEPHVGPLRVTFMGSPMHVWDVDIAWSALMYAKNYLGCETIMVGYNPAEPGTMTSEKAFFKANQWRKAISRHIEWVDPREYGRPSIPVDIGVCPLIRNNHTLGKSDVKAIEYTINGGAVVAMNNEVYNRHWKHEETALLCGSPEEMAVAVERLVKDHKLRKELVANAQEYVRKERGTERMKQEWGAAIA